MRKLVLTLAGIALAMIAADEPTQPKRIGWDDVGSSVIILGELGLPVGEEMAIHGETVLIGKGGNYFHVDKVNGKQLQPGRTIRVAGIEDWPLGAKAEIRGHEEGRLDFTAIQKTGFGENDPRFFLRQQLQLWFHPKQVLKPANQKIGRVDR